MNQYTGLSVFSHNGVHTLSHLDYYYIPIHDNELRFSESVSLSFKRRLTSDTCFAVTLRKVNFKHGTRDGKYDDVT